MTLGDAVYSKWSLDVNTPGGQDGPVQPHRGHGDLCVPVLGGGLGRREAGGEPQQRVLVLGRPPRGPGPGVGQVADTSSVIVSTVI